MVAGRRGAPKSREAKLAQHVGYIRRRLSFTAVQQQARLLLDRLGLLGDGLGEAARRRDWAVQLESPGSVPASGEAPDRERVFYSCVERDCDPLSSYIF